MGNELTLHDPAAMAAEKDYAATLSQAALVPAAYRGKPADVLVAIGLGQAIGIPAAQSLFEIYVVNGRPSPSANLMAALVRRAGHKLRIDGDHTRCTATLIRADDPDAPFTATWTIEQANAAKLTGKDTWKAYPAAMLRARAIAEVVRMGASEAVLGMEYAREEAQDMDAPVVATAVKTPGTAGLRDAVQNARPAAQPAPAQQDDDSNIEDAVEVHDDEPTVDGPKITQKQQRHLFQMFKAKGIAEAEQLSGIAHIIGRPIESRTAMTDDEWHKVIDRLEQLPDGGNQDGGDQS